MVNVFGGKNLTKKVCGECRYFILRPCGTFNMGFGVSSWGKCEGNERKDLTGRGIKFLGLVHKRMECQLPNIGKCADWKPKFHVPSGMKKARPYTAHPKSIKQFETAEDRYNKAWHHERLKELGQEVSD